MTRNYVGLACTFHDPALAIVNSRGQLVFAEASERPFQTKRAFNCLPDSYSHGVPAIYKHCEPGADLVIAKTWSAKAQRLSRVAELLRGLLALFISEGSPRGAKWGIYRNFLKSQNMSLGLASESLRFGDAFDRHIAAQTLPPKEAAQLPTRRLTTTAFNHHLTHAAAACYTSPFREAVCAVVDGFGEGTTTAFYHYHDGQIDRLPQSRRSIGSLGFYYTWLCTACGFDPVKGEEWKVMGLAPYGQRNDEVYKALKKKIVVAGLSVRRGPPFDQWVPGRDVPECSPVDLACTGQLVFEDTMTELLNNLAQLGISDNLVLGGGCALNSSYNGLILERTSFKKLHVFAAPADDGNAVGAAFLAYRRDHPEWRPQVASHTPYLGSSLSREALDNLVRFNSPQKISHHPGAIHQIAAKALAEGRIIGWVQGRAEFGPRALGNRSILADARRPNVKDRINGRVKFREEFRPFAPSILHQHGSEYFEDYQQSPYMERTLRFRPEVVDKVPGVVHVNQTGRLQSVTREMNERYYTLIEELHRLTGVPLVLNTSFNVMGKPIMHSVEDAVAVLHTTGLDALAIEDYWVENEPTSLTGKHEAPMSSGRKNQTLADYVALAISPALIMGLVASLVFFLLNVLYAGEYVERLRWILFFFVFGAVLLARMTMLDDTSSRASLYGVPLGFLTWLGMQMFVEYPEDGGVRELSWFLNAGLIGLVWWCAHRLTWDCTNIDEETDVNAEGLLQAAGLETGPDDAKTSAEDKTPSAREGWLQRWRRYREERKKKRTLGVWVVYFSLAALPLFGLGQALIDAGDEARRRTSFWLMIVYVGCGLGLLVTTCFLSLRRYLRQRNLQMPRAMTGVWLTAGGSLIVALLVLGAVLPRPDAEYSLFNLSPSKSPNRNASKYALKGDRPGEGEGRPGADDREGKKDAPDAGGKQGEQKGERGDPAKKGDNGSGGKDGNSGQGGDKKSQNGGQKQNKGDAAAGRNQPLSKDNNKKAQGDRNDRADGDKREQGSKEEQAEQANSRSPSKPSTSALRDFMSRAAPVLKWIVFALLGLAVLFFLLRSGLRFLANFSDWARRLLDALRNFWANLFGGWRRTTAEVENSEEEQERPIPERPFASFSNPFVGGQSGMATSELIRYTFAAVQAWAREHHLDRQLGETPLEFAQRVGQEVPALESDLHRLAVLYARAAYARGGVPSNSVEVLRQFWRRLETVAEQPLSA